MTWTEKTQQSETWSDKSQQAETWSAASEQAETWTDYTVGPHVFSPRIFSHASYNGKRIFSMKSADGNRETWDDVSTQSETWVAVT